MSKLLKEPLVHFIIAGVVLFFIYGFFGKGADEPNEKTIQISKGQIDLMHAHWSRQLGRPPTESELQGLIDDHIREEILMQEARAMGLDKDDIIIRRRLAQKMEFVSGDMLTVNEPTDEEISKYFDLHKKEFHVPGKVSFLQVFFSVDARPEAQSMELAEKTKNKLNMLSVDDVDFLKFGDRTMVRTEYVALSKAQIISEFGNTEIAEKVAEAQMNIWEGPFRSNFGLHLIYILEREPDYTPELQEVTSKIKTSMIDERKELLDEQFMSELRSRYTIEIHDEVINNYNYKISEFSKR